MNYSKEQEAKGTELVKTLVEKAWESASFKERLMRNPEATIAEVTGKHLTNTDKKIVVVDQTDESVVYINIPAKVDVSELELTEEQLEQVAGGILPYIVGAAIGYGVCWLADNYAH